MYKHLHGSLLRLKKCFIFALGEKKPKGCNETLGRMWEHRSMPDEDQRMKMTNHQNPRNGTMLVVWKFAHLSH